MADRKGGRKVKIQARYVVQVTYCGQGTIRHLLARIREGSRPTDFVDHRLTDLHFPQKGDGCTSSTIELVSFPWWISAREDTATILSDNGYQAVNTAELLSLRAMDPLLELAPPIAAPKDVWDDGRGYRFVPCIHAGAGRGIRLRMIDAGWAPFWRFAVKKAESE